MLKIKRDNCAPHADDANATYDSNDRRCASISAEDKIFIGIAAGICGAVLAIIALIYVRRWRKNRIEAEVACEERSMSYNRMDRPLIAQPLRSSMVASSVSSDSPRSPYSPYFGSEQSHIPILSADGHLLPVSPPEPACSYESHDMKRPLPAVPPNQPSPAVIGMYAEEDMGYDISQYYHNGGRDSI